MRLHFHSCEILHLWLHRAVSIHVLNERQIHLLQERPIVSTERWCFVCNPSTCISCYKVSRVNFPPILAILQRSILGVVVKQRLIRLTYQIAPFHFHHHFGIFQIFLISLYCSFCEYVVSSLVCNTNVINVGSYGECNITR